MYNGGEPYRKLLEGLWDETCRLNDRRTLFFHIRDEEGLARYFDSLAGSLPGEPLVLRERATVRNRSPYFPFLDWIRERVKSWSEAQIRNLLQEAAVYSLQQPVFFSYLVSGEAERREEILVEELAYECTRMQESVWNLFRRLFARRPTLLMIENAHTLPYSTFEFLNYLAFNKDPVPFLCLFSINTKASGRSEENETACRNLLETYRGLAASVNFNTGMQSERPALSHEEKLLNLERGIRLSGNCLHFLAFRDCVELATHCYNHWIVSQEPLPTSLRFRIYRILGDVHAFLGNEDNALLYYHGMLNFAQKEDNAGQMAIAFRKIGSVYLKKDDIETAEKRARNSLRLAKKLGDPQLLFSANFLLFMIEDKGRRQSITRWRESYQEIMKLASKLDLQNTISFFYTNPYGVYSQYDRNDETLHNIGIEIARRLGNEFRLAAAYQTKGLIMSVKGEYDRVIEYYKKSEQYKIRIGDPLELSYIYNGLGFYYYMTGQYREAMDNYRMAMGYLKQVLDYHEIAMTFFNIASNYFLAFEHEMAGRFLEYVLDMLSVLRMQNLAYHSLFGIYCLLGTIHCLLGEYTRAYEFMTRIKVNRLKPFPNKNEEYFFYFLFLALLTEHEGNIKRAERSFRACLRFLARTNDVIRYLEPRFWYEYGRFQQRQENKPQSQQSFQSGCHTADALGYRYYRTLLTAARRGKHLTPPRLWRIPPNENEFQWIRRAAAMEMRNMRLHRKINEINFLNAFQTLLGEESNNRRSLIRKAVDLIHNSFVVDSTMFHSRRGKLWQLVHERHTREQNQPRIPKRLLEHFTADGKEKFVEDVAGHQIEEMRKLPFVSLASLPLIRHGEVSDHLLLAVESNPEGLTRDELQVLSIAARQLAAALQRSDQALEIMHKNQELAQANQRLQQAATTDLLTGLANRTALHEKLEEESRRLQRYGGADKHFSLLFIDLDNFKYYNDNFGHRTGDMLLREFAQLLVSVARNVDFIVRYGGDEFIVLLPETDVDGAEHSAQRILSRIEERDNLQGELEQFLEQRIRIPDGLRLTCSIGIAQYDASRISNVESLLQEADHALYQAKSHGRNRFMVAGAVH